MKRGTNPLGRQTKHLPKMSERRKVYSAELAIAREAVLKRCRNLCERCGEQPATEVHHRQRRSQGGSNELSNLTGLCSADHRWVHENPALAFETGWLVHG